MGKINSYSLTWNEATMGKKRDIYEGDGAKMETVYNGRFAFQDL
jgi:hypothetical protein